jgi:hypothetical protein
MVDRCDTIIYYFCSLELVEILSMDVAVAYNMFVCLFVYFPAVQSPVLLFMMFINKKRRMFYSSSRT